jgi:D-arabinose 5-phosphate isomerase GutQ
MLSESKCQQKIEISHYLAFQTDLSGKGGAVALLNSAKRKKIKHLNENILWVTDRHDSALGQYVTVYIPPNNEEMAEITIR